MTTHRISKGLLFAFEGLDGSGKSTQAKRLSDYLTQKGLAVTLTQEPSNSVWGKKIRQYASESTYKVSPKEELNLFMKDRVEHVKDVILPSLKKKHIVITDRYYFSTLAYQGAKAVIDMETKKKVTNGVPAPDMVFYITLSPQTGISRIKKNRGVLSQFEKTDYLIKVENIFNSFDEPFIYKIDGSLPRETITKKISQLVETFINRYKV